MRIQNMGIVLPAAGIALCMFEYTLEFGSTQARMNSAKILRLAALFSLVQAALLFLSILISILILKPYQTFWASRVFQGMIAAFLLYSAVAVVKRALKGDGFEERRQNEPRVREIFRQGLRTGGKTFAAGMAAWYLGRYNLWQPFSLWAVLFAAAAGGLLYGFWYGTRWRKQICFAEGILLLALGLGVFIQM